MAKPKIYVGSVGTRIVLDCKIDITASSARSIEAQRPDRTTVSWPANIEGTTSIRFDTLVGSLNMPGKWKFQAKVTMPDGTRPGATASYTVYAPFY